jgi:hypothetical protein
MQLFRVFPYHPEASADAPGHPLHLHRGQTAGRWDNARAYALRYLSLSQAGAVGETFGNIGAWSEEMFETPFLPGARRALAVFEVDDDLPVLDLDDPRELARRSIRPSQVVTRNPVVTQALALDAFRELDDAGSPRWAGLRWWSFHRPVWFNVALWETPDRSAPLRLVRVEPLSLSHAAVEDAATTLVRPLR